MSTTEHELRAEIEALERGARGRKFTADERQQWNALNEQADEFVQRSQRVAELAGRPGALLGGAGDSVWTARRAEDDQALPHVRAGHDAGLRTIERHAGELAGGGRPPRRPDP